MKPTNTLNDWITYLEQLNPSQIKLGLERSQTVANALGLQSFTQRPNRIPTIITVAGTNGKGSTVATLAAIYKEAGYQVATYTSPHLWHFNERIQINNKPVEEKRLCEAFTKVEQARGNTHLTYFEFTTLAAFWIFQQQKLDIVILEVGMGGRLDTVNIVDTDIAVITTIDLDHQAWLGDTREQIGYEKAGICRRGQPLVCGIEIPETVYEVAKELNCPTYTLGKEFDVIEISKTTFKFLFTSSNKPSDIFVGVSERSAAVQEVMAPTLSAMDGALEPTGKYSRRVGALPLAQPHSAQTHQQKYLTQPLHKGNLLIHNIALSLMVQQLLNDCYPVTFAQLDQAITTCQLPGRQQQVEKPVQQIFDVAHNAQSVQSLAERLSENAHPGRTLAVFSMLRDKALTESIASITPYIDEWYVAGLEGERGYTTAEITQAMQQQVTCPVQAYENIRSAHKAACLAAEKENARVVIFGSFHTVAETWNGA